MDELAEKIRKCRDSWDGIPFRNDVYMSGYQDGYTDALRDVLHMIEDASD